MNIKYNQLTVNVIGKILQVDIYKLYVYKVFVEFFFSRIGKIDSLQLILIYKYT